MLNLARGFIPHFFTIPTILLLVAGYSLATLYTFWDIQFFPKSAAFSWMMCMIGYFILGRIKESIEDERVKQLRTFSFTFLGELFFGLLASLSIMMILGAEVNSGSVVPTLFLACLSGHYFILKLMINFDALENEKADLKPLHYLFFGFIFFGSAAIHYILWG